MVGPHTALACADSSAEAPASASLLRRMVDAVPALMAYYEASTLVCRFANASYAAYNGHDTASIVGLTVRQAIGETAWRAIERHVMRCLQGEQVEYVREQTLPDGAQRTIEVNLLPHLDSAGLQQGVFVLINDITEHWQTERALRLSEERMRKFSEVTSEAILFHQDGAIVDGNDALQRLLGYPLSELLGQHTWRFVAPRYRGLVADHVRRNIEYPYEAAMLHRDGYEVPVEIVARNLPQHQGKYRIAVLHDLRAHQAAQQRESRLASHDALTQLPNRHHLLESLEKTVADAQLKARTPTPVQLAVLLLDLDHFKAVNDSLGHAAGDEVLRMVAERLREGVPQHDMVARLGGDQFAVVTEAPEGRQGIEILAGNLLAAVSQRMTLGDTVLSLSPSIGISLYPDDGNNAAALLRYADAALYQAKDNGRGNWQFFEPDMAVEALEALLQEHLLREAITEGSFVLQYQPQVSLDNGDLVGLEALVRWNHPERGLVGPDAFIALAESRGMITPIGRWVLQEACRQLKAWQDEGLTLVPVAVNLSALEFRQRDVVTEIADVLQRTGLAPQWLEVELTESTLMHPNAAAHATLQALKGLGVGLSIDDFGTGYSSLAYLKRYPVDKLKIDRSFVTDAPDDAEDVAIVTAIVQMARSLQLKTVAEGVETQEQMDWLRSLGCTLAQGYAIARPLDADQVPAWLARARTSTPLPGSR